MRQLIRRSIIKFANVSQEHSPNTLLPFHLPPQLIQDPPIPTSSSDHHNATISPTVGPSSSLINTEEFNKKYSNRRCHIVSQNSNSSLTSIVQLSLPAKPIRNTKIIKLSEVSPDFAIALKGIISDLQIPPKFLQNMADQMSGKLQLRRFPASPQEVRTARTNAIRELKESDPILIDDFVNPKMNYAIGLTVQRRIKWMLKQLGYSWEPLEFEKPSQCVAYALSRFGGYFAEIRRVLTEFDRNGFQPETVLDYGSGIGSAFWAAYERWGDNVKEYTLMDVNDVVRHFSIDLLRGKNFSSSGELITKNVYFRRDLFSSSKRTYDLVILHRTLIEIGSHEERIALIEKLWKRTNRYLVIVESHMTNAFEAVMQIREHIIDEGCDFDMDSVKEQLDRFNLLDEEMIELLADSRYSKYEKYQIARSKLPKNVDIPVRISPGFVFAPCPHDQGCPKINALLNKIESCKFQVRWKELRVDHKTKSLNRDGTLTGKYCYLIMEKGRRPVGQIYSRILEKTIAPKCVSCKICTPFNGIQHFQLGKRGGPVYKLVRDTKPSQLLPVEFKIIKPKNEVDNTTNVSQQKHQNQFSELQDQLQIAVSAPKS